MLPDEIKLGPGLTMFNYGTWFNLVSVYSDECDTIEMSYQELANIPQVGALVEALREMVDFENKTDGEAFDYDAMIDDASLALAPFRKSTGDR